MSRPLTIRKPNADELHQLHQWLEQPLQSWQRRRAEVLVPPNAILGYDRFCEYRMLLQ